VERSASIDKLVVEAEIFYVMMAHSLFMTSEIDRLSHANPARFGDVATALSRYWRHKRLRWQKSWSTPGSISANWASPGSPPPLLELMCTERVPQHP